MVLDYRLGKSRTGRISTEMKALQQKLLTQIEGFEKNLYSHEMTPLEYANSVNKAFGDSLKHSVKVLEKDNYVKLFDVTVDQPMLLINPKIMVKANK